MGDRPPEEHRNPGHRLPPDLAVAGRGVEDAERLVGGHSADSEKVFQALGGCGGNPVSRKSGVHQSECETQEGSPGREAPRLARSAREAYRVYIDRRATQSAADQPPGIAPRLPREFHHSLLTHATGVTEHSVVAVLLAHMHADQAVLRRGQVQAHVIGGDGELATSSVHHHREPDASGGARSCLSAVSAARTVRPVKSTSSTRRR